MNRIKVAFERTLTLGWWSVAGILIGQYIPSVPAMLHRFEYANVSIPVAILIWLMIFPMMLKVDFKSVKNVGRKPKGILITGVTNWLIKPFTMFGIAWLFFFVLFKSLIPAELADQYLAGAVLWVPHPVPQWCLYGVISPRRCSLHPGTGGVERPDNLVALCRLWAAARHRRDCHPLGYAFSLGGSLRGGLLAGMLPAST